jgi:hypothetical protein
MNEEQLLLIAELQATTTTALTAFEAALPAIEDAAYERVIILLSQLKTLGAKTGGVIIPSAENGAIMRQIKKQLESAILNPKFVKSVNDFTENYRSLGKTVEAYINTITPNTDFNAYRYLIQDAIDTTTQQLSKGGLYTSVINPIYDLITDHVAGGGRLDSLKTVVKDVIKGTPENASGFAKLVGQTASDTIHQYERNYTHTLGKAVGATWYWYSSKTITDSRAFCLQRAGNYYHETEIQEWASSDWQGKKKDTTSVTIYANLGGYNCIHRIMPVTTARVDTPALVRVERKLSKMRPNNDKELISLRETIKLRAA